MSAADEVERVARLSWGRLVAILAARTGSVQAAADALGDALVRALETWPVQGVPARPEAWLVAAARNRLADAGRHAKVVEAARAHLDLLEEERAAMAEAATPDRILNLMFVCAHPAIDPRMHTPLMLQLVLGLDARRMAAAFLVSPDALSRRLGRARAKIETAGIGFALPDPETIEGRLGPVLDAVYAAYTVGIDGEGGGDAKSSSLAREALWLARVLADHVRHAEAQGLFALMLYAQARHPARSGPAGAFVPLEAQDSALWNGALIEEAEARLRAAGRAGVLGRYQIEAAIQAAHCGRRSGAPTDWRSIAALYRGLLALRPTTGAVCGFAAALGETDGPAAGLAVLDAVAEPRRLAYQPWWATRAHLLAAAGRLDEAADAYAYAHAGALTTDPAVQAFLAGRRAAIVAGGVADR